MDGEGVVGETPIIKPGETYKYKGYCPLTTEFGCMRGFYTMKDEDGEIFKVDIPEFPLVLKKMGSWIGSIKHFFTNVQSNIEEVTNIEETNDVKSINFNEEKATTENNIKSVGFNNDVKEEPLLSQEIKSNDDGYKPIHFQSTKV